MAFSIISFLPETKPFKASNLACFCKDVTMMYLYRNWRTEWSFTFKSY